MDRLVPSVPQWEEHVNDPGNDQYAEDAFHERTEERLPMSDRGACACADTADADDHHPWRLSPTRTDEECAVEQDQCGLYEDAEAVGSNVGEAAGRFPNRDRRFVECTTK